MLPNSREVSKDRNCPGQEQSRLFRFEDEGQKAQKQKSLFDF